MDNIDKKILDIIQTNFPIAPRPYAEIGKCLDITETEALARIRTLKQNGIIRRLGANFQSNKLGFRSTLCAAKVEPEKLENFVAEVNKIPGVTHNYIRKNIYNVWFTCISSSWEDVCLILDTLSTKTGIAILNLPATNVYKIKVNFKMQE